MLITSQCIFYSSFWWHFCNNLYELFLFYIIGALVNIAKKAYNVSKSLHCLVILQSTNFYSQWQPNTVIVVICFKVLWILIPQWSFLLTTLVAAFLFASFILQWKMTNHQNHFSVRPDNEFFCCLYPAKLTFGWMSFWYSACFDFFENLKIYKRVLLKKQHFSHVSEVLLDYS